MTSIFLLSPFLVLAVGSSPDVPAVDYLRDIKPILQAHCVDCHGTETQEAGFRADIGAGLLHGGDSGNAVKAGKADDSLLLQVVLGKHADISRMPLDADPLSESQIKVLRDWIDAGASLPDGEKVLTIQSDHWSFKPIVRSQVPEVTAKQWVNNPIDSFVLARLERDNISPSPEADKITLMRRLYLDLIGLPPTPTEVRDYLADSDPNAYKQLVRKLLNSPHFGERWGRHWLDAARYADSNGYTIDGPRSIWRYRDWVINALNRNLPFDEFVIEQLAGDLLPDASVDQRIATGFHRNTMFNEEGGTDPEQFRVERVIDRVNTTGEVFMGLTLGCAQCHTHKYDPISQREYFQIYAFFNSSDEPNLAVPTPEQESKLSLLKTELAKRTRELTASHDEWLRQLTGSSTAWQTATVASFESEGNATHTILEDGSVLLAGANAKHDTYRLATQAFPKAGATGIRLEVLLDDSLPSKGPGRAGNGNFVLSDFTVTVSSPNHPEPIAIKIEHAVADHSQPDYPIAHAVDGDAATGWAINNPATGSMNVPRTALFTFASTPTLENAVYTVTLSHSPKNNGYNIGRFRLSFTDQPGPFLLLPENIQSILAIELGKRTDQQKKELVAFQRSSDPGHSKISQELATIQKAVDTTMVISERAEPRSTYVHLRGDFLSKGAEVKPETPIVLGGMPETQFRNRLDFARWLVSENNPLTSRVMINRVWLRLFGVGIVETENDFGTQGSLPSHPELLDWLASEFIQQGWDVKRMIETIVTSSTYRQSSRERDDLASIDPTNRLLARQRRVRVEAEIIRDITLSASGLLNDKIGGPGVFPYQPDGVMDLPQVKREWKVSGNGDQYRRGMYTYFWRSSPHPILKVFDAPESLTTCTRRTRSNTPLQALMLLNDEAFVDCARALADRLLAEESSNDEQRIGLAFQLCVARTPTHEEQSILQRLVEEQRRQFASDSASAELIVGSSENAIERASWTTAARALLNLDEVITRE